MQCQRIGCTFEGTDQVTSGVWLCQGHAWFVRGTDCEEYLEGDALERLHLVLSYVPGSHVFEDNTYPRFCPYCETSPLDILVEGGEVVWMSQDACCDCRVKPYLFFPPDLGELLLLATQSVRGSTN